VGEGQLVGWRLFGLERLSSSDLRECSRISEYVVLTKRTERAAVEVAEAVQVSGAGGLLIAHPNFS